MQAVPPAGARVFVLPRIPLPVTRVARLAGRVVLITALLVAAANLAIFVSSAWLKASGPGLADVPGVTGVDNLKEVDVRVWRGANPTHRGYRDLAKAGVTTVVDLRAEPEAHVDDALIRSLGMKIVHLPVRDGQVPSQAQVRRFVTEVGEAAGKVFVHCGAGVGRTGAMAAAYLVSTGQMGTGEALRLNLTVGPPSLEQIAFVSGLERREAERPNPALVAASRLIDAPRRLWSRYGV
jgi:protein-tyrosine phosphatase